MLPLGIFGIALPWWVVGLLAVAVVLVLLLAFLRPAIRDLHQRRQLRRWRAKEKDAQTWGHIYPYYVEVKSLRELAQRVSLELSIGRRVTRSRRLSLGLKAIGGQTGGSESEEYEGQIPLKELAFEAERSWSSDGTGPAIGVATAPFIDSQDMMSTTIEQVEKENIPNHTPELLSRIQEIFGEELEAALMGRKRFEFLTIADRNLLMVFKGQFAFLEDGGEGYGPSLQLTHFNPSLGFPSPPAPEGEEREPNLIPVPRGVGLTLVLPDGSSLLPAGRERILRRSPFYAGTIAHSPSFDEETGTLTCSAWAVWGEETPTWNDLEPGYPFMRAVNDYGYHYRAGPEVGQGRR